MYATAELGRCMLTVEADQDSVSFDLRHTYDVEELLCRRVLYKPAAR